jgi:hypothetical protein
VAQLRRQEELTRLIQDRRAKTAKRIKAGKVVSIKDGGAAA